MNATATRKPRQRSIGIVERQGRLALLEIVETKGQKTKVDYYLVEPILHDYGTAAYRLEKHDGTTYDVLLDDGKEQHSCDCPGATQWGHKTRCKHVAGLLALRTAGKL